MATYATNLTTFWLEGATTVTAIGTGGAGLGNPETDFFIQSAGCISKAAWTNAIKGFIIDALATTFTVPTTGAIIFYAKYDAAGSLDTKANGGFQAIIGSGSGDYNRYFIGGKTTLAFSSWEVYTIDPNTATADGTAAGTPDGTERWVGILGNLPTTSGPTKGNPIAMDAIRYGRCDLEYTSTGCTFSGAEAWANDPTRRWGLIELRKGSYLIQGFHSFGTSGASVTFSDSNKALFILPSGSANLTNDAVATGFNRIEILNASSSVTWDNISISALGTRARGVFVHTAGTVAFTNCQFTDMDTFSFLAGASVTGTTFRRCNAITAPGSTLTNSSVVASTIAADASALVWNVATDPSGKLDGMSFTMGTTLTHAIEFGLSSPLTMTLTDVTFTGYNASNNVNDSAIHIKRTSGTVTINVAGTGNLPSYRTDGATVKVVATVDADVHVQDVTGTAIEHAQVYIQRSTPTAHTAGAGNTAGNGALVVTAAIDSDQPQAGFVSVLDRSLNKTQGYRYASWATSTFTFPTTVSGTATSTGDSTSLTATGTNFQTENYEEGDTIRNTTTGAWAVIDEITGATTVTTTPLSSGVWTSGDGFSVHDLATTLESGIDTVDTPLANGQTDASGDAPTLKYDKTEAPTAVRVRVRSNHGATKYIPYDTTATISATTGLSLNIVMAEDTEAT